MSDPGAASPGPPDRPTGFVTGVDRLLTPGGNDMMDWTSRLLLPTVASQASGIAHEAIFGFLDEADPVGRQPPAGGAGKQS